MCMCVPGCVCTLVISEETVGKQHQGTGGLGAPGTGSTVLLAPSLPTSARSLLHQTLIPGPGTLPRPCGKVAAAEAEQAGHEPA